MRRISLPAVMSPSHNFTSPDQGEGGRLGKLKPVLRKITILERPGFEHLGLGDSGSSGPQRKLSVVWAKTTPGKIPDVKKAGRVVFYGFFGGQMGIDTIPVPSSIIYLDIICDILLIGYFSFFRYVLINGSVIKEIRWSTKYPRKTAFLLHHDLMSADKNIHEK